MRYEEMFYYYKYYQTEYQNKILSMKDDKIDEQSKKIDEQSKKIDEVLKENKEQSKKIDDLLNYGKKTTEKLDEVQEDLNGMSEEFENLNEQFDDLHEQFDDLHEKVDDIKDSYKETANRSVPEPKSNKKKGMFVLLQYKVNINKFKFIGGMKQYTDKILENDYEDEYNLIEYDYNVNPIALFNKFKEIVKDELKVTKEAIKNDNTLKGRKLKLKKEAEKIKFINTNLELMNGFTLNDLINKLKEISNLKFKEYDESTDY